jgi:hypothetical protein
MFFFLLLAAFAAQNPFRSEISSIQIDEKETTGNIEILIAVPEGFHLYKDMMHIEARESQGIQFLEAVYPTGIFQPDPANPALYREHYEDTVRIALPFTLSAVGSYTPTIQVRYQGCKGGLCYKPVTDIHTISVSKVLGHEQEKPLPSPTPQPNENRMNTYFMDVVFFLFSSQTAKQ